MRMKIDLVERPDVRVAYLRYTGPFGEPVGRFWRNTVAPWLADHGLIDCPRYGVTLDDPMSTPPDKCRYDACVELPPGLSLPGASETTLRGGKYAITHFKGSGVDIGTAWGDFVSEFYAISDAGIDDMRPPFEHYPRGALYDSRTGTFACELCLPISG
jgi:AraC family transcriptional regulator